ERSVIYPRGVLTCQVPWRGRERKRAWMGGRAPLLRRCEVLPMTVPSNGDPRLRVAPSQGDRRPDLCGPRRAEGVRLVAWSGLDGMEWGRGRDGLPTLHALGSDRR